MKKLFILFSLCTWLCIHICSCSDQDESVKQLDPGTYYIEMNLNSPVETRGVENNHDFNTNYDPSYIYLHKIGADEQLYFPVYNNCPNQTGGTCIGFRYRMEVDALGNATITPINADGTYSAESITLGTKESCYFFSYDAKEWKLNDNQVSSAHWVSDPNSKYYFYYRDKDVNKEIYRSKNNLSVNDLGSNSDLIMVRACAGFNILGLFYDNQSKEANDFDNDTTYTMSEETFYKIMGSYPKEWYIKIYIGGTCFPNYYNIESNTAQNSHPNGYYSSGDGDKFTNKVLDSQKFLSLAASSYSIGSVKYQAYGYYTRTGNHLFTPVTGSTSVHIYILIKHWTGTGEPDDAWLKSDVGALQTTLTDDGSVSPSNNSFYTLGLIMDLSQFKKAWEAAGGDEAQQAAEDAVSGTTSTTRSLSGAPVREVTIPGAKVICDVY